MNHVRHPKLAVLLMALLAAAAAPAAQKKASAATPAAKKAAAAENTPRKSFGSERAPITIEVFSDYQCPACRDLYQQTLRQVINDYVSAEKVFLIHRDFPLQMHRYARDAARYANAAARAGQFEKVAEALYARQDAWAADGNVESVVSAALSPAGMKQVRHLLQTQGGQIEEAIEKDLALGRQFSVRQTPTMKIVHRNQSYPLTGVISYPILRRVLDDLLSR